MIKAIRYALATICFALSVACLGLWWRSETHVERVAGPLTRSMQLSLAAYCGRCEMTLTQYASPKWQYRSEKFDAVYRFLNTSPPYFSASAAHAPRTRREVLFPLWYPALVFALAGIGTLRLGRRFTIRSAIIATTVVAGLLGMVVAL